MFIYSIMKSMIINNLCSTTCRAAALSSWVLLDAVGVQYLLIKLIMEPWLSHAQWLEVIDS